MPNPGREARHATVECLAGAAYDEGTFHYFLAVERARAERSDHAIRLLLATLEPVERQAVPIPAASATRLFAGLRASLRETDVIGWYEQDRMAGAVLTARPGARLFEKSDVIEQRVGDELRRRLSPEAAGSLRVRIVRVHTVGTAAVRRQAGGWSE